MKLIVKIIIVLCVLIPLSNQEMYGQQDPHYTQYMYNTMSVNPGYAGSKGYLSVLALNRTQWVGIDGAPETQNLSLHAPVGYRGLGAGLNIVNDRLGPQSEVTFDGNLSYAIQTSQFGKLAIGLRLGGRVLNIDFSKGVFQNGTDVSLTNNVNNKLLPTVGAGLYYYTNKGYIGLSVPNFLENERYDGNLQSVASQRLHYFLIAGYVFDLTEELKFKPAGIYKVVPGAPISIDMSANFLFRERFTAGLAYRFDDSVSGLIGLQVTDKMYLGYAYDLTTSNYQGYNNGTYEFMLRYDFLSKPRVKSPRFF